MWSPMRSFPVCVDSIQAADQPWHAPWLMLPAQLRWPGSSMLLGADLLHRCLEGPTPDSVDVGQAVAYGLEP